MSKTEPSTGACAQDTDLKVVELCRGGDAIAFDQLVVKYRDAMVTLCARLLGNRDDGEDAAQETFLRVYRSIAGFKADCLFSTWLYGIAVNVCRNRRRLWWTRVSRRAVRLDAPRDPDGDCGCAEIGDETMSPDVEFERRRKAGAISEALERISGKFRELVVLRDVQGLSYEEILSITGLELGTVKSRLARARDALRDKLKGKIDGL